jgi:hypothetical protein
MIRHTIRAPLRLTLLLAAAVCLAALQDAGQATMKAIRYHEYGGPEVLKYEDAPKPVPKADEVLVRVHAAGVNPVDWKVVSGAFKSPNATLP